jgi:endonuclease/exonuclease/phosphatase (EEP) superfamily protein YafD
MRAVGWLVWLGVAAPTLAWALGGVAWWLDLANHFVPHALLACVVGLAAAAATRRRALAIAFLAAAVPCALRMVPAPAEPAPDGDTIRVLVANVLSSNPDHDALLDFVHAEDPDVVALLEIDPAWADALVPLQAEYPFARVVARRDNFGVALLSRVPLDDLDVLDAGGVPWLTATLPGDARLVVAHTLPPISPRYAATRDLQLQLVEQWLVGPAVVVGDLNATPWSGAFPSARVPWTPGTWPTFLPAPLRLPIDHALVSGGVVEVGRRAGPHVGSDHLPLVVDLRLPGPRS